MPGGALARKEFSWLVLAPDSTLPQPEEFSYTVSFPGEVVVDELGSTFYFKILNRDDPRKAYTLDKMVGLDPQKLAGELVLRNWRAGDSFCPIGSRQARKVKEFFRERKIPETQRKGWPVLICGSQVVWVRGFPPDATAAATEQTPRVLLVEEQPSRTSSVVWEKPI